MHTQRVQLQPAFVLHRRPYRETSWLLEVFSRDHGRVGLVARAARQARTRGGRVLEPARELLLSWAQRGELGQLGHSECSDGTTGMAGGQLFSVLYLNELLLRLITRHDPHPRLFGHYRDTLQALAQRPDTAVPLRRFEMHLLQELGYGLNLERDTEGRPIRADAQYDYRTGLGACPLQDKAMELEISGAALLALRDDHLEEAQSRREVKQLLRAALGAHIGQKPLQTPVLLRSLRQLGAKAATNAGTQP